LGRCKALEYIGKLQGDTDDNPHTDQIKKFASRCTESKPQANLSVMLSIQYPSGILVNIIDDINTKPTPESRAKSLLNLLRPCVAVTIYPTSNPHNQIDEKEKLYYVDSKARKNNKSRETVVEKLRQEVTEFNDQSDLLFSSGFNANPK